jgi:hypothetical protein
MTPLISRFKGSARVIGGITIIKVHELQIISGNGGFVGCDLIGFIRFGAICKQSVALKWKKRQEDQN